MRNIWGFSCQGKASVVLGGQYGSEGKGAAVAWLALNCNRFDIVTTNAGAQAGHTSIHDGVKRVVNHLPTAPLIRRGSTVYLNSGSIIDPDLLMRELEENRYIECCDGLYIDPMAALITQDCKDAEMADYSAQTRIASTRKGVGEALARKVLRSGKVARDHFDFRNHLRRVNLNKEMASHSKSVLVEIGQGLDLSNSSPFYPYCTSRNCTVGQGLADAHIHPSFLRSVMLVLRCHPIRVGNIVENGETRGESGECYPDQREMTWEEIGQPPEVTTVTGRVRRIFSWSMLQTQHAISQCRPDVVFLTHCDYVSQTEVRYRVNDIMKAAKTAHITVPPLLVLSRGPTTADAHVARPSDV